MTDPAERIETEQAQLLLMAERAERLRAGVTVPSSPTDQPDLAGASKQLASLTGLVRDLSDEVLFRSAEAGPRTDHDRVMSAYTDAAQQAGEAVANYSTAYAELGFQHRYRGQGAGPDLRDAREHSFACIQDRLDWTRDSLADGATRLRPVAEDLGGTPARTQASRCRTTQMISGPHAQAVAPAPPHHARTRAPGRTR
ncbi:hypothetical protein [Streptomyces reniochalinae]|uniref:Uncharacterized protein n=1 Tax=Streptomyces reniochalinae TaxID=2250578 RepID=A0A367EB32_9ACTN|nr:hypothetical protein [Streptomyces reniochalinae]RCG14942.1 hypothetical protein DQ392_28185 [Streptomyces reniochalinae]